MKTAINHVKIFDGEKVLTNDGAVLFDESGILEVGQGVFEADTVIDGRGKTLLPGLIDSHVHLGWCDGVDGESIALTAYQATQLWQYGITTVRSCTTGSQADILVRDMINAGTISGVRIVASGRGVSITGGHCWMHSHQCDTPDEVRKAARTLLRDGADQIKLLATGGMMTKGSKPGNAQLTEEQMRVAVEEAENAGAITCAHCTNLEGAKRAIRAGVRSIEHAQLDEETADMMAAAGAYYCPTIVTRYNILNITDPELMWMRAKADPGDLERKKRALMLCREKGVTICAATDGGTNTITPLGSSLATELKIYTEYGLSCTEALTAATKNGAEMMRMDDKVGSIKAGLLADLTLYEGDPTENINDLSTLCMTWQGGVLRWHK